MRRIEYFRKEARYNFPTTHKKRHISHQINIVCNINLRIKSKGAENYSEYHIVCIFMRKIVPNMKLTMTNKMYKTKHVVEMRQNKNC